MFVAFAVACQMGFTACTLTRVPESFPSALLCNSTLRSNVMERHADPAFHTALSVGDIFAAECVYIADESGIKANTQHIMRRILRKEPEKPA
jgi:hypothetical protein